METANHAIKVAPNAQGWTWELIDTDGVTSAMGSAANQEGAMELAWRAAKSFSRAATSDFPDIVLSYPDSPMSSSRSRAFRRRRS